MSQSPPKPPKVRLRDLARTLRYFRLIRGPGGGMNDFGDRLEVLLSAESHEDIVHIFATLGVAAVPLAPTPSPNPFQNVVFAEADPADGCLGESSPSGFVMIAGVLVNPLLTPSGLELSITDRDRPYDVTPAAIEAARAVEARLDALADRVIDPRTGKHPFPSRQPEAETPAEPAAPVPAPAQPEPPPAVLDIPPPAPAEIPLPPEAPPAAGSSTAARPNERLIFILTALLMAGLATLFAFWAHGNYNEHTRYSERYGDFEQWAQSPGAFKFLRLKQTSSGRNIGFSVDCEYRYEVGEKSYVGRDFSVQFSNPTLGADAAKARVESVLGISGKARWRAIRYPHVAWHLDESNLDGWELDVEGLTLLVRHSSRDPTASSLTDIPPLSPWVDWIFIVIQSVLAVAATLACLFMALASIPPSE